MSKSKDTLKDALQKRKKAIGAERDRLRKLIEEYEGLLDDCDEARSAIDDVIEILSRLA